MNLVILASGMGTRLNKKMPKCLVSINNITLLERIINEDLTPKFELKKEYQNFYIYKSNLP